MSNNKVALKSTGKAKVQKLFGRRKTDALKRAKAGEPSSHGLTTTRCGVEASSHPSYREHKGGAVKVLESTPFLRFSGVF